MAHITPKPRPNVAAYNQLHQSNDEDWQRVKPGAEAPLPIDFLVTLPDEARSSITLTPASGSRLRILSDGKPIGSITTKGVPIVLFSQTFGPGFARLGIVEVRSRCRQSPGQRRRRIGTRAGDCDFRQDRKGASVLLSTVACSP